MFDKRMPDYFKDKLGNAGRFYRQALDTNDPESVHDLRVELKYLKAFFRLVESINQDFDAQKEFKNFRKIAKNTSGLRDVQVQLKLVNKMDDSTGIDLSGYRTFLTGLETENLEKFQNFSRKNPLGNLNKSKKSIKEALQKISSVRAETRAQGRFYNLRNKLVFLNHEDDLGDEILHEVRKLTKETHYTLEIIQKCFNIFKDGKGFIKKITGVHKLLGDWHDYDVCLIYLNDFKNVGRFDISAASYKGMVKLVNEKKEAYGNNVRSVFDEFAETAAVYEHRK